LSVCVNVVMLFYSWVFFYQQKMYFLTCEQFLVFDVTKWMCVDCCSSITTFFFFGFDLLVFIVAVAAAAKSIQLFISRSLSFSSATSFHHSSENNLSESSWEVDYQKILLPFYQKIQAMDEKCFKPKIFGIYRHISNSFILFVRQLTEIVLLSSTETIKWKSNS
jgi:hypothetical protein